MRFSPLLLFLLCFLVQLPSIHAYIYVNNETYASLPALFGRFLLDGKTYRARLQYYHENPFLCEMDENTKNKFVLPGGPQIPDSHGGNVTLVEPVILMVSRGNCPFQRKAAIAESISDSIKFLLVYNFNLDHSREQEEVLVPMYSQFGNTRLVLLSVSHGTGQALKQFLSQQPASVIATGGPLIEFDSEPPLGILTAADLQSMMLSALGLFFMLISFTGCLVILAGTYSQIAQQQGGGGNPIAAATQRRLLTEAEVHQLTAATTAAAPAAAASDIETSTEVAAAAQSRNDSLDRDGDGGATPSDEDHQCAVCLDEFEPDSEITALPCRHVFHTDCILPWLTERQSKCPLCKFDVLQHLRDQNSAGGEEPLAAAAASIWDRVRRYRWTSVHTDDDSQRGGTAADPSNGDLRFEEDPTSGVELTERPHLS